MTDRPESLQAAFEATEYRVLAGPRGPFVIRCGARSADADGLLAAAGVESWAFVTACNPRSTRCSAAENAARMRRLADLVRDRGLAHCTGAGTAVGSDWPPEPRLLVHGITEADAVDLGRAFDQLAIVVGRRGGPARLVWIDAAGPA